MNISSITQENLWDLNDYPRTFITQIKTHLIRQNTSMIAMEDSINNINNQVAINVYMENQINLKREVPLEEEMVIKSMNIITREEVTHPCIKVSLDDLTFVKFAS